MSTEAGKFVMESYIENNDYAINIMKMFLLKHGYKIKEKLYEDYDIDILAEKNNKEFLFEVEIKTGYSFTTRESFRFNTVSFLARKEKWKNTQFYYVIICKETDYALVANSDKIFKNEYKENININTYYRNGKDSFYRVPKEMCKFFKIK